MKRSKTMWNDIKLIVCDLDGTLLDPQGQIDRLMLQQIPLLKDKGIAFSVASGRNYHIMQDTILACKIQIPYIANNGANIYDESGCLYNCAIDKQEIRIIADILKHENLSYIAYAHDELFKVNDNKKIHHFAQRLIGKCEIIDMDAQTKMLNKPIFKIVICAEEPYALNQAKKLIEYHCPHSRCQQSENDVFAINHCDASKGNALIRIAEDLGLQCTEVLFFGDNYNDLSVFDKFPNCVAMANADREIKLKARYICKSNNENGVGSFVKKHLL
ncbi:MAG: HAD family hydrolase [Erysipelotrichaceae bacterium]|nr:HAD family hydrolase [Erysipelotrichaceae bacterium]